MRESGEGETSPLLTNAEPRNGNSETYGSNGSTIVNGSNGHADSAKNDELVAKTNDPAEPTDASSQEVEYQGLPEAQKKLKFIVPSVSLGIFMIAADATIIVSAYGRIGDDLKSLNKTSWLSTAYFLTLTSFQPLYGKLSDIFGRKPCLIFAYSIFGLGCLLCGLARNIDELIAARAFAGIGGGGMTTVVSILLSDIVPLRQRGTWQGVMNIVYATGSAAGAPLGGFLADSVGWRAAFLAQAPLCAVAILVVGLALHLPAREVDKLGTRLRRVDFLGALILVAAVFALLFGLDRGSNDSWSKPIAYVPTALFLPLAILFVVVEFKVASEPFAPKRIIFERSLASSYACNFFMFASWFAVLFYIPLFYQAVDGFKASEAGLRLLPAILASCPGSLFGGLIIQKTGKYYWLTVIAYTAATLFSIPILLCSGLVVNSTLGISIGLAGSGFGFGIGVTTILIGLISNASTEDIAVATACSYLFRSLGSVVGVSVTATIVQYSLRLQLNEKLRDADNAGEIVKRVRESLEYVKKLDPATQAIVRKCYGNAVSHGFIFTLVVAFLTLLSSLYMKEKRIKK